MPNNTPNNTRYPLPNAKSQAGVALVISLILLVIVTMLAVSAMRSSKIDVKIAVNHQHKQIAFQAAENAFAKLLAGKASDVTAPGSVDADPEVNTNFIQQQSTDTTPGTSADLTLDMILKSKPGQYKFSGYGLNVITIIYQADALGKVDGTNATAHNRMEAALLRY